MSARRLNVLLRWLPADASVWAGEPVSWGPPLELAATQAELLHAACRLLMQIGGVKRHSLPDPLRVPRPGQPRHGRGGSFNADRFMEYVGRMEPREG